MATCSEGKSFHASESSQEKRKIDICFINKEGKVSVGDSTQYGNVTPGPSATPSLSSRASTGASSKTTKSLKNSAAATESNGALGPESSQHIKTTSIAKDSSQRSSSKEKLSKSESDSDNTLHPEDFLVGGESLVPDKPDDAYFTLIWLDRFYKVIAAPKSEGNDEPNQEKQQTSEKDVRVSKKDLTHKDFNSMDDCYIKVLESLKLCGDCKKHTQEVLWRNIREYESRYESRCRTCEEEGGVCFLKFHTMQAPYLNESNFILALVHHVRIPLKSGGRYGEPKEHIFAFVLGLSANEISELFHSLRCYWDTTDIDNTEHASNSPDRDPKDVALTNPRREEVGLTARLFLAAILRLYGFLIAQNSILKSFGKLECIFEELRKIGEVVGEKIGSDDEQSPYSNIGNNAAQITENDEATLKAKLKQQMAMLKSLNVQLMTMDSALPGVRSRVHYVGLCAQGLLREESSIQKYIVDKLEDMEAEKTEGAASSMPNRTLSADQDHNSQATPPVGGDASNQGKSLRQIMRAFSSSHYKRRDDDKLDMLNRSMQQFEVDIKSLKARANIAIGLASTAEARAQGNSQLLVVQATERDGSIMRKIATWTVLLLPATFFALLITTPMIQWAKPVVKVASSGDSDSPFDKGRPILAVLPFFLWLGLSVCFSLPLLLNLLAKRDNMKTFPWIMKKAKELPITLTKPVRQFGCDRHTMWKSTVKSHGLHLRSKDKTPTVKVERGEGEQFGPCASMPATAAKGTLETPVMSGGRNSSESTLHNGSTAGEMESIPMRSLKSPKSAPSIPH